uniref:NADH-ubiquinone oxidoreductase chain 6 n=1 Tax=Pylocheles mortensenii TaxID=941203 RepID=A0A3S6JB19_9EUCA|nr:NADH dehydrogenase subunit 6 [Pylocheles mortensenii]
MLHITLPIIMTISILFLRLKHPLSTGITLLIQTFLISISAGLNNKSFWFSYILFLVFLGGMLVLFIYITSLASNEPFDFKLQFFPILFIFMLYFLFMFILLDPMLITNNINIPISSMMETFIIKENMYTISSLYNFPSAPLTLFIIFYLLLMLLVVVKIMSLSSAPLRLSV